MIKYEDYFPKSVLNKCGIVPDTQLFSDEDLHNMSTNSGEADIDGIIGNIYSNITKSALQKTTTAELRNCNINRRIVAMLCDLDVIDGTSKDRYLENAEQRVSDMERDNIETRISIELPELSTNYHNDKVEKSEKVTDNRLNLDIKGKQK